MNERSKLLSLAIAVFACVTLLAGAQEQNRVLPLPQEFAGYRSWRMLLNTPHIVPMKLWMQCVAPTQQDWDEARKTHGPHTERMIQVYANDTARKTLKKSSNKVFAAGSILAKEKLIETKYNPAAFSGIAFMVKRSSTQFQDSGGWEFRYFPSNENERAEIQANCAGCHKTAPADYVFGDYSGKK